MIRFIAAALSVLLGAGQISAASAQDGDDWEFAEDRAQNLSVAAVRYDDGKTIVSQCRDGDLKLVISGLPGTSAPTRGFEAVRADGRMDTQTWTVASSDGVLTSSATGRDARFLRGGGAYELRSRPGEPSPVHATFDLPQQSANLDRVLVACGRQLEDERDRLRIAELTSWGRDRDRAPPPSRRERQVTVVSIVEMSCIVRNLRLQECRADQELPRGQGHGARAARSMNSTPVEAADPATAEGRVLYITTTTDRRLVN